MRRWIISYISFQLFFAFVVSPAFAQGDEKPLYSDSTSVESKKVPGSSSDDNKPAFKVEDIVIYGDRITVDQSEKELITPPDILSSPRGLPVKQDKGILAIQESLDKKQGLTGEEQGRLRKYLYRASAEFGTYNTIPISFFHGNQIENFNYFLDLRYEQSSGHVDNSAYKEARLEGRMNYKLDSSSNIALKSSYFYKPYELYGKSSNLILERDRRFKIIDGNINLTTLMLNKLAVQASFSADKAYLLEREFEEDTWEDSENNYLTKFTVNGLWSRHLITIDAAFAHNKIDYHSAGSFDMNYFMIQPKWQWASTPQIATVVGATILGYDSDVIGNKSAIAPYLKLTYSFPQGIILSGLFRSSVTGHTLKTYWQKNAFIDSSFAAIPEYRPIEFETMVDYNPTSLIELRAGWNLSQIKNMPLYERRLSNEDTSGLEYNTYTWSVIPAESLLSVDELTRNLFFFEGALKPASGLRLSLNLNFRSFKHYLAYQPNLESSFVVDFRSENYVNARFSFDITGEQYVLNRKSSESKPEILDPYISLNIDLSRSVYKNITAILRGHNLTDSTSEKWEDYDRPGRKFLFGVMIDF